MNGSLITFEGIDFCGKSVQIKKFIDRLQFLEVPTLLLREPGGTILAEKIREILLAKEDEEMNSITEYLLYSSARAQLVRQRIIPALENGVIVICDRFYDSSTAYQGYGRGIDLEAVNQINNLATNGVKPNLTFFIDIDLEEMEHRKSQFNNELDRIESEKHSFFEKVRNGFFKIAEKEPERFCIINGKNTIEFISEEIWNVFQKRVTKLV